jgi:hypothetical protein
MAKRPPKMFWRVNNGRYDFFAVARTAGAAVAKFRRRFHVQTPTDHSSRGWQGVSVCCLGRIPF